MKTVVRQGVIPEVENVPEPRPGLGQAIVRVEAAAIRGTDLHLQDFGAKASGYRVLSAGKGG